MSRTHACHPCGQPAPNAIIAEDPLSSHSLLAFRRPIAIPESNHPIRKDQVPGRPSQEADPRAGNAMTRRNFLIAERIIFGLLTLIAVGTQLAVHISHKFDVVNFFSYFTNLS